MPHFNFPETIQLSKEQFDKIVELLTPGYKMSKLYLAQLAAQNALPTQEPQEPLKDVTPPPDNPNVE